nr:MAG TPA: hypothetical protein [Caudoviricetes sp.]
MPPPRHSFSISPFFIYLYLHNLPFHLYTAAVGI